MTLIGPSGATWLWLTQELLGKWFESRSQLDLCWDLDSNHFLSNSCVNQSQVAPEGPMSVMGSAQPSSQLDHEVRVSLFQNLSTEICFDTTRMNELKITWCWCKNRRRVNVSITLVAHVALVRKKCLYRVDFTSSSWTTIAPFYANPSPSLWKGVEYCPIERTYNVSSICINPINRETSVSILMWSHLHFFMEENIYIPWETNLWQS